MAQGVTKVAQIEALVAQVGALVAEVEVPIAGLMCLNAGLVYAWFLFFRAPCLWSVTVWLKKM